jgi:hypothetical protein
MGFNEIRPESCGDGCGCDFGCKYDWAKMNYDLKHTRFHEVTGNMWDIPADAYCITTNGFVKKNGEAVMGAGCALEAKQRYEWLPLKLGKSISCYGNHVFEFGDGLVTFPVKHKWFEKADMLLIQKSAVQLMELVEGSGWKKVILPRPGCGNGRLKWDDVKAVLTPILDERIYIVSK